MNEKQYAYSPLHECTWNSMSRFLLMKKDVMKNLVGACEIKEFIIQTCICPHTLLVSAN